jgi:hypothetical protein
MGMQVEEGLMRRQKAGGKRKHRAGDILAPDPFPFQGLELRPVALVDNLQLHIELQPDGPCIRRDEQRLVPVGVPDEARRQGETEKRCRLLPFGDL